MNADWGQVGTSRYKETPKEKRHYMVGEKKAWKKRGRDGTNFRRNENRKGKKSQTRFNWGGRVKMISRYGRR